MLYDQSGGRRVSPCSADLSDEALNQGSDPCISMYLCTGGTLKPKTSNHSFQRNLFVKIIERTG